MSEHHHTPKIEREFFDYSKVAGITPILGGVGAIALLISFVGAFVSREQFAFSWLFAFAYFFTLCAGSLFWIIVHHATDAEWSVVVRRQLENVAGLFPAVAIFWLPVLFCAGTLYHWWGKPLESDPLLAAKWPYLTIWFFVLRAILFFAFFIGAALLFRKLSSAQDDNGNPGFTVSMRKLTFFSLPCFAIALTFGAFDWLMGLDYHWFSTMWGVYIFAGAAGSSMSLLVLIVTALRNAGYLKVVTPEHYHVMGKLMLAFVVFWAYIGFSQYMLVWYANIPEEATYYLRRNTESWWYVSTFLVWGRFVGPLAFLLMQPLKRRPRALCMIAGWILFMQVVDIYLIVLPMLHPKGFSPRFLDLVTWIGIGATLAFLFLRSLKKTALYPARDPRVNASVRLSN